MKNIIHCFVDDTAYFMYNTLMDKKLGVERDNLIARLYGRGYSIKEIAFLTGCKYSQPIANSLRRQNIKIIKYWPGASGYHNGRWSGGIRWIKGYKHILLPEHHLARTDGYVAEHRYIAEKLIGRKLLPSEVVNHKDRNTRNNSPDNLEVYGSNGEHIALHARYDFKRDKHGRWEH